MKTKVRYQKDLNPTTLTATQKNITLKFSLGPTRKQIDYSVKSALRKHYIKGLGLYTGDLLTKGNDKLSNSILIFDIPAVSTCLNCKTCKTDCYALKSQLQYPGTYNKRVLNYWIAKNDLTLFKKMIINQLDRSKSPIVRIHTSGDFFSQEYINAWVYIAKIFDNKSFYCYTKTDKIFTFPKLKNFNIVKSILPNGKKNFGTMPELKVMKKELKKQGIKSKVCTYGIEKNKKTKCGVNCMHCMNNEYVLFKTH